MGTANGSWVVCEVCGDEDKSRKPLAFCEGGPRPGYVGTSTKMRCQDCGGVERLTSQGVEIGGPAKRCRSCCETGHRTR